MMLIHSFQFWEFFPKPQKFSGHLKFFVRKMCWENFGIVEGNLGNFGEILKFFLVKILGQNTEFYRASRRILSFEKI